MLFRRHMANCPDVTLATVTIPTPGTSKFYGRTMGGEVAVSALQQLALGIVVGVGVVACVTLG